ncbi:hypothetical protein QAD02_013664 [Eretmocerus hayati]|uniref:Uncharacterized protein n=1 Tax=Eretmocerus hayati TaxID=131215 RepID=A0ACC2P614_9HYME|nr:hypothetical protein QAD02_013664 [Eretmocerus hayati]
MERNLAERPISDGLRLKAPPPLQYQALARLIDLYYQQARELFCVLRNKRYFSGRICLLSYRRNRDDWITTWRRNQPEFIDCTLQRNLIKRKADPLERTRRRVINHKGKRYRFWETPIGEIFPDTFSIRINSGGKSEYLNLPKPLHKLLACGIEHLLSLSHKTQLLKDDSNCIFINRTCYENHRLKGWRRTIIGLPFIPKRVYYTLRFQFSKEGPRSVPYADDRHIARFNYPGIDHLFVCWRDRVYDASSHYPYCCWKCTCGHLDIKRDLIPWLGRRLYRSQYLHDSTAYEQIGLHHYAIQDCRRYPAKEEFSSSKESVCANRV